MERMCDSMNFVIDADHADRYERMTATRGFGQRSIRPGSSCGVRPSNACTTITGLLVAWIPQASSMACSGWASMSVHGERESPSQLVGEREANAEPATGIAQPVPGRCEDEIGACRRPWSRGGEHVEATEHPGHRQ